MSYKLFSFVMLSEALAQSKHLDRNVEILHFVQNDKGEQLIIVAYCNHANPYIT
jgi:hypothetical protein